MSDFSGYTALVVDDEKITRLMVARMTTDLGFQAVKQAADGQAALAVIRSTAVDVVVCDVYMEPMDGLDMVRALRAEPEPSVSAVPVILMTNLADDEALARGRSLGIAAFIEKPIDRTSLGRLLAEALAGRAPLPSRDAAAPEGMAAGE